MPINLESAGFRVTVLPEHGGKVRELYHYGLRRNLLLPRLPGSDLPLPDGAVFSVSGWDECLPTVEASLGVPDLGYAWRTEPQCRVEANRLITRWEVPGWRLERAITVEEKAVTSRCVMTNAGPKDAPLLWAGHVLLPLEGLREVVLPGGDLLPGPGCDVEELARERLSGVAGDWHIRDIRRRGMSWKFFLPADRPVMLQYADAVLTLTTEAGWWGIWLNEGNFCDLLCLGVEPTNVPSDALGDSRILVPPDSTATATWRLEVS
ncbi:MAG: hypothetical protein ACYC6A_16695 [Armatimonadota bacterium]